MTPSQGMLLSVKLTHGLIKTSQSASSYPRNYTDTAKLTVPYRLTVLEVNVVELDGNGVALAVGMIKSMLAKRITGMRLFFIKDSNPLGGSNIKVPGESEILFSME